MANWLYGISDPIGYAWADGSTKWVPLAGDGNWDTAASEAQTQVKVYGNYTWSKASIRIQANATTGASVLQARKNGVNGNQLVSIPAGATGLFQDLVNTDALVNGDLVNWRMVPASVNNISISFVICLLDGDPIQQGFNMGGVLNYVLIGGDADSSATESEVQYRVRSSKTFSKMRVYIHVNVGAACSLYFRKNGANGNEVISIPAATTGSFEDAVNTDSVVSGDLLNYYGVGGSPAKTVMQITSSGNRLLIGGTIGGNVLYGAQRQPPEGWVATSNTTEARTQFPALTALTIKNLLIRVSVNTRDGITTFTSRKNGVDGSLSASIPATTTGTFEDTANSDSLISTDLYNYGWTPGGTSGQMNIYLMGVEEQQPAAPPTVKAFTPNQSKLVAAGVI